jgi:hypothetical protein
MMAATDSASHNLTPRANEQNPITPPMTRKERVHVLRGKYAFVPFSSEDHIRQKEIEKRLEGEKT